MTLKKKKEMDNSGIQEPKYLIYFAMFLREHLWWKDKKITGIDMCDPNHRRSQIDLSEKKDCLKLYVIE